MLDCPDLPEFTVHGTRRIELRPDGMVCIWQCEDYTSGNDAMPVFCVPRVKIVLPVQNILWNAQAITQWALELGIADVPPRGPTLLLPSRGSRH